MKYYFDTDICITILRGKSEHLTNAIKAISPDKIKISSIVKAELLLGAQKSTHPKRTLFFVEAFLEPFEIIAFCDQCTDTYAKIRSFLEKTRKIIGANDLLIAATVLAHQGTLITHNTKEYQRVSGLKIEDWM